MQIFISQRRGQNAVIAGRIEDRLCEVFGRRAVITDVESLHPGVDISAALDAVLAKRTVMLVLIGPRWAEATNARGRPRLHDPDDIVRLEITRTLAEGQTVIPVLIEAASLAGADLPPDLATLANRQGFTITLDDFERDMQDMVIGLKGFITDR